MSYYLAADGLQVTSVNLSIPYYGLPVADVALATASQLASPVTLSIGNLSMMMSVYGLASGSTSIRTFAGVTTARLVGGAAKWATPITLAPYRAPPGSAGVLMSSVLKDLAAMTGETIVVGADRNLGPFFVPETGAPASRLLQVLAGSLWWVDANGVTQVASARPTSNIGTIASVAHFSGARGWAQVATEDPAAWMPGASFTNAMATWTISATRIHAGDDGNLRVEVLTQ